MITASTIGQLRARSRVKPAPLPPQAFDLPEPIVQAIDLIQAGMPMAEVASALGVRNVRALRARLYQHGIQVRAVLAAPATRVFSADQVATLFSATGTKVRRWVRTGTLVARRNEGESWRIPKQRKLLITEQSVLDFLALRKEWPSWEVADVTDCDLQAEAARLRAAAGGQWLRLADWARAHGYTPGAAQQWVAVGLLPVLTYGRVFYVWSTDLENWQPPAGWSTAWDAAGRPRTTPQRSKEHHNADLRPAR